jgi:hypothetical protein
MKRLAAGLLQVLAFIYIGGVGISLLYFNWQYAKQNGFMSWLVLGQVVPSLQSAIWPYYVLHHRETPGPATDASSSLAHFAASIEFRNEATLLLEPPPGTIGQYSVPREKSDRALQLMRSALAESYRVPDDVLRTLHPDLPTQYEQDFRGGLKLYVDVLGQGRFDLAPEAVGRLDRFGDWYNRNLRVADQP